MQESMPYEEQPVRLARALNGVNNAKEEMTHTLYVVVDEGESGFPGASVWYRCEYGSTARALVPRN
jgi:hypothetical protein